MGSRKNKRRRKRATVENEHLVFANEDVTFWEVDTVLDRRVHRGEVQYLIKWKGYPSSRATWEPIDNLCDTALEEALELDRISGDANFVDSNTEQLGEFKQELVISGESQLFSQASDLATDDPFEPITDRDDDLKLSTSPTQESTNASPLPPPPLEDGRWRWTDEEQLNFREIERINVEDSDARQRVTDARLNGTPVVLVGHRGWANFAKEWLVPANKEMETTGQTTEHNMGDSGWLDLAKDHHLDVDKMAAVIGNDVVPVIGNNYNEHNPLQAKMKVSAFLKTCWPDAEGKFNTSERLYLHQWQFPLAATAGKQLCHKNRELPNQILGDDLLKYWLDLPQCRMDSALQYLFMGREGTMSKLHCDKGGLAISIAPIVGVKECVLVHRSDGATCFYHLDASLDNIDLRKYPLMAHARIWKTSIVPGEILLMPQGTYHQCRNLTPCLSYSRFHLDTVNLLPFLQSMVDGDAKEIEHGEVIWNACIGVMKRVDEFVDQCRSVVEATPSSPCPDLTDEIALEVDTLRSLRNICQETFRRLEGLKAKDRQQSDNLNDIGTCSDWLKMLSDIDESLHHFRYRQEQKIRPRPRKRKASDDDAKATRPFETENAKVTVHGEFGSNMAAALASLEYRSRFRSKMPKPRETELATSDLVIVRLPKGEALGKIIAIEDEMKSAYLSYDGYPSIYDEYQPYSKIRISVGGESVEVKPTDVKVGATVLNRWGDTGEEYRAVVVRTYNARFFSVRLHVPPSYYFDRWFPIEDIVSRASLNGSSR